ncbi:ATP-dependent RNA helicase DDX19/DBP5, partial [Pancytospora epiphaga]
KTVAFSLGALQQVEQGKGPQVVVLTPTRELSNQVGEVIATFGKFVNISVCFALRNFVADSISEEVVVGSPGKILGLLNSKIIDGSSIKVLVLDEADELISQQSFSAQTIRLVKALSNAQKIFFSATYSDFSQQSVKKLLPKCDTFFEKNQKADKIQLYYVEIDKTTKIAALKTLFGLLTVAQTIVFVATRRMVDVVSKELVTDGFSVSKIHGELDPIERDGAFRDFYQAKTKVLVSTDLFSRGMDIPQVNLIINFDLPSDTHKKMDETYIHRVGRSGRFDRSGFVIDFIT